MDQQQIRGLSDSPELAVRFSLGTKLVISVLGLLLIVIGFLNLSTIFLFKEDKRAYIYQAQATSSVLAGREFVNLSRHALDTLRLTLGSIEPSSSDFKKQSESLTTISRNQSELALISVQLVNPTTFRATQLGRTARAKEFAEAKLAESDAELSESLLKAILPSLLKDSYTFINPSRMGGAPVLGVIAADLSLKNNPAGMPVAVGLIPLTEFGKGVSGLNLTIATRNGWVLYDSDPAVQFASKNISEDALFKAAVDSKVATGALEYDSNGERLLGSYVTPGLDLVVTSRTEWKKAMKATYALIETVIYLGLMAIGVAAILAILFSKTLTAPLKRLYEGTKEVAGGNFDLELNVQSKDEIGALTGSFNVMSRKISELIQEQLKKAHLENELAIASTVQQTLIPPEEFADDQVIIHSHYRSASECGGDWWGFFRVENKLCLMIADATGHGLPSALITASARSCASVLHKLAQEDPEFSFSPAAMLSYANRVIYDASMGKIMMTFFCGVVDFDKQTLKYANAGHNPPWLFKHSENGKYELKSIVASGMRLGENRDNSAFEEKEIPLSPDDVLFMYTDGLMEGMSPAGDMYGKKRVRRMIEGSIGQGAARIIPQLMADFLAHNGEKPLDDDVTLAVARLMPSSPAGGAFSG